MFSATRVALSALAIPGVLTAETGNLQRNDLSIMASHDWRDDRSVKQVAAVRRHSAELAMGTCFVSRRHSAVKLVEGLWRKRAFKRIFNLSLHTR